MRTILMNDDEILNLKRASQRAKRSPDTLRRWCRDFGIARQPGGRNGPLEISLVGLEMVVHGDFEALELLREDRRDHPQVVRYLVHLGLMSPN